MIAARKGLNPASPIEPASSHPYPAPLLPPHQPSLHSVYPLMSHFCRRYATKAMHPSPEKGIKDKNPPRSDTQIIRKKQVWQFCHDPRAVPLTVVPDSYFFSSLLCARSSLDPGALKEPPNGPAPGQDGPLGSLGGSRSSSAARPVFCQRPVVPGSAPCSRPPLPVEAVRLS